MIFNRERDQAVAAAAGIRLLLLDVDGVLTDGRLYYSSSGDELKAFSTLDGHGIKMLMAADIEVGIITARSSDLVARRAQELGIKLLFQGQQDKLEALQTIAEQQQLDTAAIAYAGDDYPDLPVLRRVGLALAVANAHHEVRTICHCVTEASGGNGAVREITDFILMSQDRYHQFLEQH